MEDVKNVIIVCVICFVAASIISGVTAYKYVSAVYEAEIEKDKADALALLQEETKKVLIAERKNNDITRKLNEIAASNDKTISTLQNELRSYRDANGRLLLKSNNCNPTTTTPNSPSTSVATGASDNSAGFSILSTGFGELLSQTFSDADKMRMSLLVCKQYAEAVEAQRKEMSNE